MLMIEPYVTGSWDLSLGLFHGSQTLHDKTQPRSVRVLVFLLPGGGRINSNSHTQKLSPLEIRIKLIF